MRFIDRVDSSGKTLLPQVVAEYHDWGGLRRFVRGKQSASKYWCAIKQAEGGGTHLRFRNRNGKALIDRQVAFAQKERAQIPDRAKLCTPAFKVMQRASIRARCHDIDVLNGDGQRATWGCWDCD